MHDDGREIVEPVHISIVLDRVLAKVAAAIQAGKTWPQLEAELSRTELHWLHQIEGRAR